MPILVSASESVSGTAVDVWKNNAKAINTQALILQWPSAVVLATVF